MTNETVDSLTIELDPYVAEVISRSGLSPDRFARLGVALAVKQLEMNRATHIAKCRNCYRPVHTTAWEPDHWLHGNPNRSRGCRTSTFTPGVYPYWDDSLSRSWQAKPENDSVREAPDDYDIGEAWDAAGW